MKSGSKFLLLCALLLQTAACLQAQVLKKRAPKARHTYKFIRYKLNAIRNDVALYPFFAALDSLEQGTRQKVSIVHLGDSHIQADVFSGQLRSHFQHDSLFGNGGRGFVFPYTAAKTNNPFNYKTTVTGLWQGCRNTWRSSVCPLGVAGISATTHDTTATLVINPNRLPGTYYPISRVRVLYTAADSSFIPAVSAGTGEVTLVELVAPTLPGVKEFVLSPAVTSVRLSVQRTDTAQKVFTLQGLLLENDEPGIVYHALGVNGADVPAWLRCTELESQLTLLQPDLLIISLGTNDAFRRPFLSESFKEQYLSLLERVQAASPNTTLLLTTPGDCYKSRRYVNTAIAQASEAIKQVADRQQAASWDFYNIMGGLRSVLKWQYAKLAGKDRVHLTNKGYAYQGDLLYDALMQSYYRWKTTLRPNATSQP